MKKIILKSAKARSTAYDMLTIPVYDEDGTYLNKQCVIKAVKVGAKPNGDPIVTLDIQTIKGE